MSLEIIVTGAREVNAMLGRIAPDKQGKAMENALKAGALLIANQAKANAPFVSGTLRRSIHVGGHTHNGSDGSDIGGNSATEVRVGTNVPYARRIEYGFTGVDALGRRYNQAAQPYLRPAMDSQKGAAVREVGNALRELLNAQGL